MPPLLTNSNASCTSETLTGSAAPPSIFSRTWIGRPAFEASPARRTVKPALVIVKTWFWLAGRFLSRRFQGWSRKNAVLNGGPREERCACAGTAPTGGRIRERSGEVRCFDALLEL